MKKLFFCVLFLILSIFAFPQITFAHFPATDGKITITLHVDPNDDPTPGQQAQLYFLFTFNNSTKKFNIQDCNCIVTISEQGKKILQQKLTDNRNPHVSIWGANMPIVFPADDVYAIAIKGEPVTAGEFKPFSLSWNFRVDTTNPGLVKPEFSDIQVLVFSWAVGIIALVLIGIFVKREFAGGDK